MFTNKHHVLMRCLETEMLLQKQHCDILLKLKDLSGIYNYYIYHYSPHTGFVYALVDRGDYTSIDITSFYIDDLSGPFLYFNQFPYARMDYHDKQRELNEAYKNKHSIIF